MVGIIILLVYGFAFLLCQVEATKSFSTTDVNNFIYIAKLLVEGKLLYKDIFLDNFPLAPYIAVIYRTISFGDLHVFRLTGTIEAIAVSGILYWYYWKKTKSQIPALLSSLTFCTSFVFMRTAVDQSGLYTAIGFITLGYIFFEKKQFGRSAVFTALAILTKAYMLPLALAIFIASVVQHREKSLRFVIAGTLTGIVVMLPTLLFAFPQFLKQTFGYGLVRAVIEPKDYIINMLQYDIPVMLLFISAWFLRSKSLVIWIMALLTPIFFLFYKDFYYVYFIMFVFVASITIPVWWEELESESYRTIVLYCYSIVAILIFLWNANFLINYTLQSQTFPNSEAFMTAIKAEKPDAIYAIASVGNGVSYISGIPPYKNLIDLTGNQFASGVLDKTALTKEVLKTRTLLLINATRRGDTMILDDEIVDLAVLKTAPCKQIYTQPLVLHGGQILTYMIVLKCY